MIMFMTLLLALYSKLVHHMHIMLRVTVGLCPHCNRVTAAKVLLNEQNVLQYHHSVAGLLTACCAVHTCCGLVLTSTSKIHICQP